MLPAVTTAQPDERPRVVRTDTRLADGRDLFYYDPPGTRREPPPDIRELPAQPESGQARFDPRTGDWVFVAWEAPKAMVPNGRLWVSDEKGLRSYMADLDQMVALGN